MQPYKAADPPEEGFAASSQAARYCGMLVDKAAEQVWSATLDIDWQVPQQRSWWLPPQPCDPDQPVPARRTGRQVGVRDAAAAAA